MVDEIPEAKEELLTFPTSYPIKVVGRRSELQRADVWTR